MSENTPMRRRRPPQPVQIDDASIPHKSDEDNPVHPAREIPPHRRVRVVPIETTDDDAPRHLPESPLSSLPTPVRFGALALALILLIVGSVSITRTYLAHQEERRRLEAEAAERAQHPLYYADTITAYADAQELDPALVAAVILCESSYDPKAESRLGARGLMQLMPDTAEWVAHKLGEDGADYSFDNLYDPQTNIRFGTWYLGYLSRRFNGDATENCLRLSCRSGQCGQLAQEPAVQLRRRDPRRHPHAGYGDLRLPRPARTRYLPQVLFPD